MHSPYEKIRFCMAILLLVCAAGCGIDRPVVILENISWPDGSVVSIIQNGRIADRSTLYGDNVRLRAASPGLCRIRAGGVEALTWLSEEIPLSEGENRMSLPVPSARRRTGGGMLGFSTPVPGTDFINGLLFENPVPGVTTLTVQYEGVTNDDVLGEADVAHNYAVEIIASIPLKALPENRKSEKVFKDMLDCMEAAGVDGVFLVPGGDIYALDTFPRFVRIAAREIHLRGMTLSVMVPVALPEHADAGMFFRDIPAPEVPDMVRVAAPQPSEENPSPDTVLQIERVVDRLARDGVPLSRISAEIALSAAAFTPRQGGGYDHAPLEPGKLDEILRIAGMDAVLRLRDGTLRLGFRGRVYSFEDVEGLTWKLRLLHESPFAPKGGVHIMYDGMGIKLDRNGLKRLADAYSVR